MSETAAQLRRMPPAGKSTSITFRAAWLYGDPSPPVGHGGRLSIANLRTMKERLLRARSNGELPAPQANAELRRVEDGIREATAGVVVYGVVGQPYPRRDPGGDGTRARRKRERRARKAGRKARKR